MEVMKAWLSLNVLLLFLAPLTLNAEPSPLLFSAEHSATKSWSKVDTTHNYAVIEAEEKIEEASDEDISTPLPFSNDKIFASRVYLNLLSATSKHLWSPVLQFCSRFTNSPPY